MIKVFSLELYLILISPILLISCDSSKKDPLYIGKWQFTTTVTLGEIVYKTTRTLELTRSSFEEIYKIERDIKGHITAIIGTRGDLSGSHSNITFNLKEIGRCIPDVSENCTENVEWFGQGSEYYTDNIGYFEEVVSGTFELTGNTMKLIRDLNNDNDFDDTGENVTFTMI